MDIGLVTKEAHHHYVPNKVMADMKNTLYKLIPVTEIQKKNSHILKPNSS